jgi:hypothetical protein
MGRRVNLKSVGKVLKAKEKRKKIKKFFASIFKRRKSRLDFNSY